MNRILLRFLGFGLVYASHVAMAQYPALGALTIPAAASANGVGGTLWRTDLWITSLSNEHLFLDVRFECRAGCANDRLFTHRVILAPHESRLLEDVLGTVFQLPGTSGALRIAEPGCWKGCPPATPFFATSRTYTVGSSHRGSYGTSVPAFSKAQGTVAAVFPGAASHGLDKGAGFRTNAGFTPSLAESSYAATFALRDIAGGPLGSPLTLLGSGPLQIDDIFAAVGAGDVVTRDATLEITATIPGIPYAFVIDNASGDAVFQHGLFAPLAPDPQ